MAWSDSPKSKLAASVGTEAKHNVQALNSEAQTHYKLDIIPHLMSYKVSSSFFHRYAFLVKSKNKRK